MFATAHKSPRKVAEMTAKAVDGKVLETVLARMKELLAAKFNGKQARLADALDVTPTAVSDVLGGTKGPGLKMLISLAREMEISLDELVGLVPRTKQDSWGAIEGYADVEATARVSFPRVRDTTWRALARLRGVEPPALNPTALGMLAAAWDQHAPAAALPTAAKSKKRAKKPAAPPSATASTPTTPKKPRTA